MLHAHPLGLAESPTSLGGVKRTVKACASCRHDKTRCDETRPCGHCHRKGLTAEQCVFGCEACRQARACCEGGVPCTRCMSMHLNCVDGATMPLTALHWQGKSGGRAQLACKNCRRDNKKCEDQRPCRRCVMRSDECVHVVRRPKLVKVRCQSCRGANRRCEEARPCYHCSTRGEVCIDPPRKGRGQGMRVKVACVKCREHKVRCDGQRPCASCNRKGFICQDRSGPLKHHLWPIPGAVTRSQSSLNAISTPSTPEPGFGLRKANDTQIKDTQLY
ncbi:hypothetical protein BJV74DRAFT_330599 [Russula compacta]|nr:hypothetical protein BJV74DRAFT_330599 [Russula compacta]